MSVCSTRGVRPCDTLLCSELFIGVIAEVSLSEAKVSLAHTGLPSGTHYCGERYGRGEVGELVLVEGEGQLLLARIVEVKLPEADRKIIRDVSRVSYKFDATGRVQLLGTVELGGQKMDCVRVKAGIKRYPRLGDRVYSAPVEFVAKLPALMEDAKREGNEEELTLDLGYISGAQQFITSLRIERVFGRHCAIVGATGGGKSWTMAKLIEECMKHDCKIVLFDPTGEYSAFSGNDVLTCRPDMGGESKGGGDEAEVFSIPPSAFTESDFFALFTPSTQAQLPILRRAIRSLRLARCLSEEDTSELMKSGYLDGDNRNFCILKAGNEKDPIIKMEIKYAHRLEDPHQEFNVNLLEKQINNECVYDTGFNNDCTRWGNIDQKSKDNCSSLILRIEAITKSPAFYCVFRSEAKLMIKEKIDEFVADDQKKLLRICFDEIPDEFNAREILANAIGRMLLKKARGGQFKNKPTVVFLDEAHGFLGRQLKIGDSMNYPLDAFELIAKEGRKYGLNLCVASQRPRDIPEGVISQMGTLIVHRLINESDRKVVESACSEFDREASAILPMLQQGEALVVGTDLPIPLVIQIDEPTQKPRSEGPSYQKHWRKAAE